MVLRASLSFTLISSRNLAVPKRSEDPLCLFELKCQWEFYVLPTFRKKPRVRDIICVNLLATVGAYGRSTCFRFAETRGAYGRSLHVARRSN